MLSLCFNPVQTVLFQALDQYYISICSWGHLLTLFSVCVLCFLAGPVLFDHVTLAVCRHMALRLPHRVALLPNKLHGHAHFLFLQFLQSGQSMLHFIYLFYYFIKIIATFFSYTKITELTKRSICIPTVNFLSSSPQSSVFVERCKGAIEYAIFWYNSQAKEINQQAYFKNMVHVSLQVNPCLLSFLKPDEFNLLVKKTFCISHLVCFSPHNRLFVS